MHQDDPPERRLPFGAGPPAASLADNGSTAGDVDQFVSGQLALRDQIHCGHKKLHVLGQKSDQLPGIRFPSLPMVWWFFFEVIIPEWFGIPILSESG